jgi:succinyl-diaminopimelate desuccinylase
MHDVITLTKALIACPSVTPVDAGALVYLSEKLTALGFECQMLSFGEGADRVPNLFARLGTGGPHLCYGGHTDVVPAGDESAWTYGAFTPHIENGILYGRGASDMKGSVAAFTAAVSAYLKKHGKPKGSISLLITGDEEGPAINGTVKVLEWMKANNHIPNVALVGEPTNPSALGQEIKIGRRGSLSGKLTVTGKQGHVAYPHNADNPVPRMIALLQVLCAAKLDNGTEFFPATNLEVTSIDIGNKADNVIPAAVSAKFNIRFNDIWTSESLSAKIRALLDSTGHKYDLTLTCGAESFLTKPGEWSDVMLRAVKDVTGKTAAFTTNGGTSDARFMVKYCPVVEFGGINSTVHQVNENAAVSDLEKLTDVFTRLLELYFAD